MMGISKLSIKGEDTVSILNVIHIQSDTYYYIHPPPPPTIVISQIWYLIILTEQSLHSHIEQSRMLSHTHHEHVMG